MAGILLKNAYLVTETGVAKGDCLLTNGKISLSQTKGEADKTMDLTGKYIVPGLVDIHVHGYAGFDFTHGLYDAKNNKWDENTELIPKYLDILRNKYAEFGVTGFYISSVMTSIKRLKDIYKCLSDYLATTSQTGNGARLLGGALEAPFISPAKAGAMAGNLVKEPSIEVFEKIDDKGSIKLANIVPDFGEKSCELTEYLTKKGIVVGAGHTAATCQQVADAVKAGLKYCVHFTNQTDGLYKPFNGGGAIEAVLKIDELYAEIIADGYHVNPAYIRDIIKRKGIDKILGMTDCMFVGGSNIKRIEIGGVPGRVADDGSHIAVEGVKNTLYGSVLKMCKAFENMLNWLTVGMEGIWNKRHDAMSLNDALVWVSKMYSTNSNKLTGRYNEGFGRIADGLMADLTIFDINGTAGNYQLAVESTIVNGEIVYSANT
jgi:N-acetylglucosamine-6-phosphate deacetylase